MYTPVKEKKIAIIHYWWMINRGGEAVISALLELYPHADLFIHVHDEELVNETIGSFHKGKVYNTFIAKLPFAKKHYQKYLPLMPMALEQLDLDEYDLIISNESGPTKGILSRPDAVHICYQLSPMRYIWDMHHEYMNDLSGITKFIFRITSHYLRMWDRLSADKVDYFVPISRFVESRVTKFYRRESEEIIPCPVNSTHFDPSKKRKDFYLCLGQLVPYKKADMAVDAFNELGLPLKVIGDGALYKSLKNKARPNVDIMGRQDFKVVKEALETCKGLIFPGVEDFGIVPLEAMAAGAPVIAYGRGGACDTVIHGKTGLLYENQTIEAIIESVQSIENGEVEFDVNVLKEHAESFDKSVFKDRIKNLVDRVST